MDYKNQYFYKLRVISFYFFLTHPKDYIHPPPLCLLLMKMIIQRLWFILKARLTNGLSKNNRICLYGHIVSLTSCKIKVNEMLCGIRVLLFAVYLFM